MAADPPLDDSARGWALDYIASAGSDLTREAAGRVLDATGSLGGRVKSLRIAYLGDVLLRLEAVGYPAKIACAHAPWIARGAPQPRPTLAPLSAAQRRDAIAKRREVEEELRAGPFGLKPEPAPRSPSDREREAFGASERAARRQQGERAARLQARRNLAQQPILVEGFPENVVLVLVVAIFRGVSIPSHLAPTAEELRVALDRLRYLDGRRWKVLRDLALSAGAPKPKERDGPHIRWCVAWLVACTDVASEEANRSSAEPLATLVSWSTASTNRRMLGGETNEVPAQ